MCRHIGYIGKEQSISDVLINKEHSLLKMAYDPKEMENAKLNADGFGIGWYKDKNLFLYKNYLPIWNDPNLDTVTKSIKSKLVIGNVRSATLVGSSSYQNAHPFRWKNLLFSHNGYIKDFEKKVKRKIIKLINNSLLAQMNGNTDSEYIFFLLIQVYIKEKNIPIALRKVISILSNICEAAMLNLLVANYNKNNSLSLHATRVGYNLKSPSLYYKFLDKKFIYISSEGLDNKHWKRVSDFSLIECTNNKLLINSL